MGKFPGITVEVSNNNLLSNIAVSDGTGALVVTVKTASLVGIVQKIYSLTDAESKGYTEDAEPFVHNLVKEFYNELGGNMLLYLMGIADSTTMASALDASNAEGAVKVLNAASGDINLLAIARDPATGYEAGTKFLDQDVPAAVTASKALAQAYQNKNTPLRIFIEGRVANETVANDFKPSENTNGFAAVVLGSTEANGSASVTLALARACLYPAHIKLGSGANGALSIDQLYIGSKTIEERLDMDEFAQDGFLTFHHRPGIAGYFFGVDNMCSADDFSILVHGRVIDKAQRVAVKAYAPFLETEVRVNDDGTINSSDAKYIEDTLKTALLSAMGDQVSDIQVSVPVDQNIVDTSTVTISVAVLPLGYLTYITIQLGLTASISA